jgi:hypothetical protein
MTPFASPTPLSPKSLSPTPAGPQPAVPTLPLGLARASARPATGRRPVRGAASLPLPGAAPLASEWQAVGQALGREFARMGLLPPTPALRPGSPLSEGWAQGGATRAQRSGHTGLRPLADTQAWLGLRLKAWMQGVALELLHITPAVLAQCRPSHCPISRAPLHTPVFERLHPQAAYAAGHVVALGPQAAAWLRGSLDTPCTEAEVARLDSLRSAVVPLPHAQAAAQPLRVLPPPRVRLFNPVQALGVWVSRQFLQDGWSQRLAQLERRIPGVENQHRFRHLVMAFMPRVLSACREPADSLQRRWAVEDAWACPRVLSRWQAFALGLDAERCEALLQGLEARTTGAAGAIASPKRGTPARLAHFSIEAATEGWQLGRAGRLAGLPGGQSTLQ